LPSTEAGVRRRRFRQRCSRRRQRAGAGDAGAGVLRFDLHGLPDAGAGRLRGGAGDPAAGNGGKAGGGDRGHDGGGVAEARESCLAAGMDEHIPKPVKLEDFIEALQKWLPDKASVKEPVALVSDCEGRSVE